MLPQANYGGEPIHASREMFAPTVEGGIQPVKSAQGLT